MHKRRMWRIWPCFSSGVHLELRRSVDQTATCLFADLQDLRRTYISNDLEQGMPDLAVGDWKEVAAQHLLFDSLKVTPFQSRHTLGV